MKTRWGHCVARVIMVVALAGCANKGTTPQGSSGGVAGGSGSQTPSGSASTSAEPSPSPSATTTEKPLKEQAFKITATTSLFTSSSRFCPGDRFITHPQDRGWSARHTEINGGPPNSWDGKEMYYIDEGVTIDVARKIYYFVYTEGRDSYQVARGNLTVVFAPDGHPLSGKGTGKIEAIYANGDGEWLKDRMTFTITPTKAPTWC